MRKWLGLVIGFIFVATGFIPIANVAVSAPYEGYNYSYWEETVPSPVAYLPAKVIDGQSLGIGDLLEPEELYVTENNEIYVLDSGNSRIIHLDEQWNVIKVIQGFTDGLEQGQFKGAQGMFVTPDGEIYVADTENQRILELTQEGTLVREIKAPQTEVIRTDFRYFPRKIALDRAKRIYVIGRGVYEGIMELDTDGTFSRFMGTNRVSFNAADLFWKNFATQEQRNKMISFIPVEFNSIDIDSQGFIYTTTADMNASNPIQRLNPRGVDVLRDQGYFTPSGDLDYPRVGNQSGKSLFTDVVIDGNGIYSALDAKRGRIFTYNDDGDLLYVFGQLGSQTGTFQNPVAIEKLHEQILVLDRGSNHITIFEPTRFGKEVNLASAYFYHGNDEEAAKVWENVLRLNANYEIAYIGMGKSYLRQDRVEEAMAYFKIGHERVYYSKSYAIHRKIVLREHFSTIATTLAFIAVLAFAIRIGMKRRKKGGDVHAS